MACKAQQAQADGAWWNNIAEDHKRAADNLKTKLFGTSQSAESDIEQSKSASADLRHAQWAASMSSADEDEEAHTDAWVAHVKQQARAPPRAAVVAAADSARFGSRAASGLDAQAAADYELRLRQAEARGPAGMSSDDEDMGTVSGGYTYHPPALPHVGHTGAQPAVVAAASSPASHSSRASVSAESASSLNSCSESDAEQQPICPLKTAVALLAQAGAGGGSGEEDVAPEAGVLAPSRFMGLPDAPLPPDSLQLAAAVLTHAEGVEAAVEGADVDHTWAPALGDSAGDEAVEGEVRDALLAKPPRLANNALPRAGGKQRAVQVTADDVEEIFGGSRR